MEQARLKELLEYNPETGLWTHRNNGKPAGTIRPDGRRQMWMDGKAHLATRLAWLYMTGDWPDRLVDHKRPGKEFRADDRWSQLRLATVKQNNCNRVYTGSVMKGVQKRPSGRFTARFGSECLGTYDTDAEAHQVWLAKAVERYGEFAHGGSL